jgi:transposase
MPICPRPERQTHNGHLSDDGGERAAVIYTIAETAKLNGLDPEAYIAAVLDRLARGHTITRLDDLLPWNFKPERQAA